MKILPQSNLSSIRSTHQASAENLSNKTRVKRAILTTALALIIISSLALVTFGGITSSPALIIAGTSLLLISIISLVYTHLRRKQPTTPSQPQLPSSQPQRLMTDSLRAALPYSTMYAELLNKNFHPLSSLNQALHGVFCLRNENAPTLLWEVGDNHCCALMSTLGDISLKAVIPWETQVNSMVVNAANETMARGGRGTNAALSRATSVYSWSLSTENKTHLKEGEITSGVFSNPENKPKPSDFTYLCQALGPQAANHNNSANQCFQITRQAYLSICERAKTLECSLVQLPLLSTGVYAPRTAEREEWICASQAALLSALVEFERKHPEYNLLVIVIGNQTLPIS